MDSQQLRERAQNLLGHVRNAQDKQVVAQFLAAHAELLEQAEELNRRLEELLTWYGVVRQRLELCAAAAAGDVIDYVPTNQTRRTKETLETKSIPAAKSVTGKNRRTSTTRVRK